MMDVDTPRLIADLDAVERNIARMQTYSNEHNIALRPHIKTHKIPALAEKQLHAGAVGIACQKLGEAEVMSDSGIRDIFITFPLIGQEKAKRLATLTEKTHVAVAGDSVKVAEGLSAILHSEGVEVDFFVECDTGFHRTGVQTPTDAADLAEIVASLPGLRFTGLMTYPTNTESRPWLCTARNEIERRGLTVECISGGGTPTAFSTHLIPEITEIRVGTYVFGDRSCIHNHSVALADCALRVLATVVSRPTRDRAILDAGTKTLTSDPVHGTDQTDYGLIVEYPAARISALSEEHGHVDISGCVRGLEVGEVVSIVPNHACGTVNMHDELMVHRQGVVEGVWRVAARGKIR